MCAGETDSSVAVYRDPAIAAYGFGAGHPFGPDRHDAFHTELQRRGLAERVSLVKAVAASRAELCSFHAEAYVDFVADCCQQGSGFLDGGDTPAQPGLYESAAAVAGATLDAVNRVQSGDVRRAFVPIAGLHHAGRQHAAGFCVFNDCGIAIEILRRRHGVQRIAYVDIDAHHGDGVFYAFEEDPDVFIADLHEDGRYIYPGTGTASETGLGVARGSKLNLPLDPGAGDTEFLAAWNQVTAKMQQAQPEFILLQCGADSLADDPITHLRCSAAAHAKVAADLCRYADKYCDGRLVAMGGGGYNRQNLANSWTAVVGELLRVG